LIDVPAIKLDGCSTEKLSLDSSVQVFTGELNPELEEFENGAAQALQHCGILSQELPHSK
jgi:hypothetical protein